MKLGSAIFLALLLCSSRGVLAQSTDSTRRDSLARVTLPAVITTAKRYAAPNENIPQRVDVISATDLQRTAALDVTDALKKLAAVDVIQYPGILSGIGIRGFRPQTGGISQRTLVLIDGRPSGAYNIALLDMATVERIEVLKGPASSLYGSSAVGGAINIVTRKSTGTSFGGRVTSSYGSFRTSESAVQMGGMISDRLDADLSFRYYDQGSDYRLGSGSFLRDLVGSDSALKVYPDGSKPSRNVPDVFGSGATRQFTTFGTRSGSLRGGYRISEELRIEAQGSMFDANDVLNPGDIYTEGTSSDGSARKNVAHRSGSASANITRGVHSVLLRPWWSRENTENYDAVDPGSFISFSSENTTAGLQAQDVLALNGVRLLTGIDFSSTLASSKRFSSADVEIGSFNPNSRVSSVAGFTEGQITLLGDRLNVTVGARIDRISLQLLETPLRPDVDGDRDSFLAFNPSAGLSYATAGGVRVHISGGRAFLAPDAFGRAGISRTLTQDVAAYTIGNPGLAPEHSFSVDAGIGLLRRTLGIDADITYFRTAVDDRITRARASFPAGSRPTTTSGTAVSRVDASVNAGDASIEGVELKLAFDIGAALGWQRSLRIFSNSTRIIRAEEKSPTVAVDVAQFANASDFDPSQIFDALTFTPATLVSRIKNVAELSATGGIEYDDRERFNVRLSARYVGERLDSDFRDASDVSDVVYPSFMVADLTTGFRLTNQYSVDVTVSNLSDENYYEKRGYNLSGRAVKLRLVVLF